MDLDEIRLRSFGAHVLLFSPPKARPPNQRFGNLQRRVVIVSHNELVLSDGEQPFLHILYITYNISLNSVL